MKKIICILLSMVILATSLSISVFADDEIKVCINGEKIEFDTEPTIINGRTFVPIRAVCEKLGADVYWWEEYEEVVIVKNDIKILLQIENNEMVRFECRDYEHFYELSKADKIDEYAKEIEMDVTPVILNGRTLLPIRYVCEELGATVEWVTTTSTVNIKCSNDTLQSSNTDKSFFDKLYFCGGLSDNKILATAQTNEERIEKAIYFLELYFNTDALIHTEVSPTDNLYFEIKNTAIYKLNNEYPKYYDDFDKKYEQYDGSNVDYIVEFEGVTNQYSFLESYDYIYAVTFYKDGTCGLRVELKGIDGEIVFDPCPPEIKVLVQDYGNEYNKIITYPSSDGGVTIFGV